MADVGNATKSDKTLECWCCWPYRRKPTWHVTSPSNPGGERVCGRHLGSTVIRLSAAAKKDGWLGSVTVLPLEVDRG